MFFFATIDRPNKTGSLHHRTSSNEEECDNMFCVQSGGQNYADSDSSSIASISHCSEWHVVGTISDTPCCLYLFNIW